MRRRVRLAVFAALLVVLGLATLPATFRAAWRWRSSNPVRRGIARAEELGCFSCHGVRGAGPGLPDPGLPDKPVPAWAGGEWMMLVEDDAAIRQTILDGISRERAASESAAAERAARELAMPAYRRVLQGSDVEDLIAAFKVLSGMSVAPAGTPAREGQELARRHGCFRCHGAAGSGGLPNPGSLTGFIPGWYGPDFRDLVRDRGEFEAWIRDGKLERLERHPVASRFLGRQRISMPRYAFSAAELDALWAYAGWLAESEGGSAGPRPF